jgi:N-acetylneuraminic acid mutarotase
MMKRTFQFMTAALLTLLASLAFSAHAAPLGSTITYQGKLHEAGQPANGTFEFEFVLYDAPTGGNVVGPVVTREEVPVVQGVFTLQLDFGPGAFNGDARWMQIYVKNDVTGTNGVLSPRTPIHPTPYALLAADVKDGVISNAKLADGAVNGSKISAGSVGSPQLASSSIGSTHLANGAVQSQHIAPGAVGTPQLADASVASPKLAPAAVGTPQLADASVTGPKLAPGAVTGSHIAAGTITSDRLADGVLQQTLQESGQSAVASGGIIMSEQPNNPDLIGAGYSLIGQVKLLGESWTNRPPPSAIALFGSDKRRDHAAVWTGTEMLIWGGLKLGDSGTPDVAVNTGWRYHPATDTWLPMSTNGAPSARHFAAAVWTGTEMLVWGGRHQSEVAALGDGARYNPSTDTWSPMNSNNAPSARARAGAIWTGSEMIIWGGGNWVWNDVLSTYFFETTTTGARYNPANNTWSATTTNGAPSKRYSPHAFWTGSRLLVWGGEEEGFLGTIYMFDGGSYNPANNTWTSVSSSPEADDPVAVWSGTNMLVWGRNLFSQGLGFRYNPANNTWSSISTNNGPGGRFGASAAWTGSRFIVWGGLNDHTGASYNPANNSWTQIATNASVHPRVGNSTLWTGSEMIIWGGNVETGGRYNPSTDSWALTAPRYDTLERTGFSSIWTGVEWIIWGGRSTENYLLHTGFRYKPATKTWSALSTTNGPSAREKHTAVWTGSEMIIWGGIGQEGVLNTGTRYNPATDSWTAVPTNGLAPRRGHTAVWSGTEMLLWGGRDQANTTVDRGYRFNPATSTWTPMRLLGAPSARVGHTAIWSGSEMIIWGGSGVLWAGRYNPQTDTWTNSTTVGAPSARTNHTATWTGKEMIIIGGQWGTNYPATAFSYVPNTDTWRELSFQTARANHTAVWAGTRVIAFGGVTEFGPPQGGGAWQPENETWTPLTTTNAPVGVTQHAAAWTGTEMLVWGGLTRTFQKPQLTFTNICAAYTPERNVYLYLRP